MRRLFGILALLILLPLSAAADPDLAGTIFSLVNGQRAGGGARPLTPRDELARAALGHSKEMLKLNYFDHVSPTPGLTDFWDRIMREGYDPRASAENLYRGFPMALNAQAQEVVTLWLNHPGHRRNMLSSKYHRAGVGIATDGKVIYVTMVFANE
ncbi:MAG: CAP domain-containing protein [Candidatus Eremiobacteraeota bacterium]|nr:CAP domain-containing protein [Candidatus Eremiobacteraeota bacterium]